MIGGNERKYFVGRMGLRNEDSGIVSECFAGILEYGLLWIDGRCPERVLSLVF
jgi:hypothetical protein